MASWFAFRIKLYLLRGIQHTKITDVDAEGDLLWVGLARTVYIYIYIHRTFGDFQAKNTVCTPYIIYGSGQLAASSGVHVAADKAWVPRLAILERITVV
jgi:hypothetical protein